MEILLIGIIIVFVFQYGKTIDSRKFFKENESYFMLLKEKDYEFLVRAKYGDEADPEILFSKRIRNGLVGILVLFFALISTMNITYFLICVLGGFLIFKSDYTRLKNYYKRHLHEIDLMLPYYLKNLEILVQHYTVPVALGKSVETAPPIFRDGLRELVDAIDSGDSTVNPYMDFAKKYPVRDSMRMMRLLYRLGLGAQDKKQQQLILFSRSVSTLQNKAREQRYKERLGVMENKTMVMLGVTGGGIMVILVFAMLMMFQF